MTTENTTARPAFIDEGIVKYRPGLRGIALRLTKGKEDVAELLLTDTVIDCLTHWQSYRTEGGGFFKWLEWRMRGKWSHMGVAQKRRNTAIDDFARIAGVHDEAEEGNETMIVASVPPNQETVVEVAMMLRRIEDIKYSGDFCRMLVGETLNEIAGGACSNQAIDQRTRIARAIAAQGL